MTVTFGSVLLPEASKLMETPEVILKETLLLSGRKSIQASTYTGFGASYSCVGTWDQYQDLLDEVGSSGTLTTEAGESYTKCYISSIKVAETDAPGYYEIKLEFRQDTT